MSQAGDRRLSTWAEIAAYIGRDVRTARRYEAERGLPVRRLPGSRSTVFAFTRDLDAWRAGPSPGTAEAPAAAPRPAAASERQAPRRVGVSGGGWRGLAAVGGGAAVAVAAAAGVGWLTLRPVDRPLAAGGIGVVLADVRNSTGDPAFDAVVRRLAEADLSQSPMLQVASESRIADTLDLMKQPKTSPMTPATAQAVCQRLDAGAVVQPTISTLGRRYVLLLAATGCVDGRSLDRERGEAAGKEQVPAVLDALSARLRRRLGESQASIARLDVPLVPARTGSFDALLAYSEGMDLHRRGQIAEAAAAFQHAVDLDPGFAAAWLALGQQNYNLKQPEAAVQATTRAYELRANTSQRLGLLIASRYDMDVAKDLYASLREITLMAQLYPNDVAAWGNLSNVQNWLGRFDEAVASGRRTLALDPKRLGAYSVLARALNHSGRTAEAVKVDRMAMAAGVAAGDTRGQLIADLYLLDQFAASEKLVAESAGTPLERDALIEATDIAVARGRIREADGLRERAEMLGAAQGLHLSHTAHAYDAVLLGLTAEARRELELTPLALRSDDYILAEAGVAPPARVEADLAREVARSPHDTLLNDQYAPLVRAELLLRRGDGRGAVHALAPASALAGRSLDVPYMLGRALLMAGDAAGAAVQFRWILAHKGLGPDPQYDLAHLGLARALWAAGDAPGARGEYARFLAEWKDADADLPELVAARAESARLGHG